MKVYFQPYRLIDHNIVYNCTVGLSWCQLIYWKYIDKLIILAIYFVNQTYIKASMMIFLAFLFRFVPGKEIKYSNIPCLKIPGLLLFLITLTVFANLSWFLYTPGSVMHDVLVSVVASFCFYF